MQESDMVLTLQTGFKMACKRWKGGEKRMFCYPGWLDNAGSFDSIAPYLAKAGFDVVAVDPPGCGLSQHLPRYCTYNDFEEVAMIADALEELSWTENVTLVAHSRGGGIALACAASFPKFANAVVLFDAKIMSMGGAWPDQRLMSHVNLAKSRSLDMKNSARTPRTFESLDEAVLHSYNNPNFPKSMETARNITARHVKELPDGRFQFTHDVRTYGQSQKAFFSMQKNKEFISNVQVPVHLITGAAGSGMSKIRFDDLLHTVSVEIAERKASMKDFTETTSPGMHHFHSDHPKEASERVLKFLDSVLPKSKL
eukprot:TRINITY_DN2802_c2_g1_i1.p1 TRINITY_DN2802_c2_g1~~TRINITY_DN2802_c2_g1_i1.p1  ORF type:complete len:312 (+),score=58.99 TRINITY_DN2802_c2_g1_i1:41-976(+)